MDYYWEIVKRGGETIEVVPSAVEVIRKRWDDGEPIHFKDMTIPAHQIVDFRKTSKPYGQPLIEAAAQAFSEPMITPDGGIRSRWVKKEVTHREYEKEFAGIPSYRKLGNDGGLVQVAFRLPIHEIDTARLDYCSDTEIEHLEKL